MMKSNCAKRIWIAAVAAFATGAAATAASKPALRNFRRNMVSPFSDGENKKPASNVEAGWVQPRVTRTAARNLYVKAWSMEL